MKHFLFFLLIFVHSVGLRGQNKLEERCGSSIDYDKLQKYNPFLFNYLKEIDRKAGEYSLQQKKNQASPQSILNTSTVVTIPVVVHVIHNGEAIGVGRNISVAQIQSQITQFLFYRFYLT